MCCVRACRRSFAMGPPFLFSSFAKGGRTCSGLPLDIPICGSGLKLRCISLRGDGPVRGRAWFSSCFFAGTAPSVFCFFVFDSGFLCGAASSCCLLARFARRRSVCWLLRWHPRFVSVLQASPFRWAGLGAGIRVTLAPFTRCPCAGRHLLFFAAAKKSRQKKAAHTANS